MTLFIPKPSRRKVLRCLPVCLLALLIVGCPAATPPTSNRPPNANAGEDQVVSAGATVTLDGSQSSDPDGDSLLFSWKQAAGAAVSLNNAAEPIVTFTAPPTGATLKFELVISDGRESANATLNVLVQPTDSSARVTEVLQRSVTDDPFVSGDFPNDWLISDAGRGLPSAPAEESEEEIEEFQKMFKGTLASPLVQEELEPGATQTVELEVPGASGLAGLVQWVQTTEPLEVSLALDGQRIATGNSYQMGKNRGGSYLRALTSDGGTATISVTNTSGVTVTIRIIFMATAL